MLLQSFKQKPPHLTADAAKGREHDHHNISRPETGIFVTHSPTKTYSKNNFSNMLLSNNATTTLLIMLLVFLLCIRQHCLASWEEQTTATATATTTPLATKSSGNYLKKTPPVAATYECNSMDLRHNCKDFNRLYNCTVVTGFLSIAHYFGPTIECNETYKFVNLREITDFLIISELRNFTSIKDMFPNLTVIRGRKLFRSYALVFSSDYVLEKIEFKSLIALQRGHALVEGLEKLCFTEKINWERLALSKGKSNIYQHNKAKCPQKAECRGCKRDACWSNEVCQKFEDDSVLSQTQDPKTECHEECLGGCYNRTAQGCVVCKRYTDHGTCVKECPEDKYACSLYLRCYTREECINEKELLILNNTCVAVCPIGHRKNNVTGVCDPCDGNKAGCTRVCESRIASYDTTIYVTSIGMAETLKYCQIINGSLVIEMFEYFDPEELKIQLKYITEIRGFLKINRAPFLTSLDFLENLETIHGQTLDNGQFALIIYNNIRLSELWSLKPGFEIRNGGMYIHANSKLCNRRIKHFRRRAKHDKSLDSIQKSDQEVLCSPATLNLDVQVINHRSIKLYWPRNETAAEVEIVYKPVAENELLTEKSELDPNVCNRINWHRELKFANELQSNITHYIYVVQDLEPRTRYGTLVKTFNGADDDDTQEARSEIKYVTTKFDIPRAPKIVVVSKTFDTLQIEFYPDSINPLSSQVVDFYNLEVYHMLDKKRILDRRNYCDEPAMDFREFPYEDYDSCCTRLEIERQETKFLSKLKQEFSCSLDHTEYCKQNDKHINDKTMPRAIFTKRFEARETGFSVQGLKSYHLYVLQMQACNRAGCSSYSILSARTNYSVTADKMTDFSCCRDEETNEYRVYFTEPKQQNGYISSYTLHLRYHNFSEDTMTADRSALMCIRPSEHLRNSYVSTKQTNLTFNQATLKVASFGRHTFIEWVNITTCSPRNAVPNIANYMLAFGLIILIGYTTWCCRKRHCWQRIRNVIRDFMPLHTGWRYLRPLSHGQDDRQILVNGFEVFSFRNNSEEIELQERSEFD